MDEEATIRRAALGSVGDIEPVGLQERIARQLAEGSMVPGVLTLLTARVLAEGTTASVVSGEDSLLDAVADRATGVQLIYEGLRLTRALAHDPPWAAGDDGADLDILAADVLVARGFYLLARTEAADTAVETVRAFGRDQTVRHETDDRTPDWSLEADVLELAVVAGAACSGVAAPARLREFAVDLANDVDPATVDGHGFPAPVTFFSDGVRDQLSAVVTDTGSSGGVTTSVDD